MCLARTEVPTLLLLLFFFSIEFRLKMLKVTILSIDQSHCLWIDVLAMLSFAIAVFDWRLSIRVYLMLKQGIIYITSLVKCCNDSYFVTMGTNLKPCDWYRRTRFRMRWLAIGGEHGSVCDGSLSYGTLHLTSSFKVLLDQGVTKKRGECGEKTSISLYLLENWCDVASEKTRSGNGRRDHRSAIRLPGVRVNWC